MRYCHDPNANVPVPVFFMFDLETILNKPETMFSGESLAGNNSELNCGIDAFSKLDFKEIYKKGYMQNPSEEKKKRQAEIVYPGVFNIRSALRYIVCRNEVERATLLNLLKMENINLFNEFKNCILVIPDCFERNGLFIEDCNWTDSSVVLTFSSTASKEKYTHMYREVDSDELRVKAFVEFDWMRGNSIIDRKSCGFVVDYEKTMSFTFKGLKQPVDASELYMRVFFEGKLVCYMCWHITSAVML